MPSAPDRTGSGEGVTVQGTDVVVFAGPTLARDSEEEALRDLTARVDVRPPARRGDVLTAVGDGAGTMVILDGYYYTVPSVTHKEILYALDCGVRVIGAASLGALRAAELEAFGMIGVGSVFEAYRDGTLDGDDEVALLHGPAEADYLPLTVALVEVRHALERLVEEEVVSPEAAERLVAELEAVGFVERTPARVRSLADRLLCEAGAVRLLDALDRPGVKQRDAHAALELALAPDNQNEEAGAAGSGKSPRHGARDRFHPTPQTGFLHHFKELSIGLPARRGDRVVPVAHAWALAQVLHPDAPDFVRSVRLRYLLYSAAERAGLDVAEERVEREASRLEERHRSRFGRSLLPPLDYVEEARIVELSRAARRELGGTVPALATLARSLRVDASEPMESLLALLSGQPDALPPWSLARPFSFDAAFEPAQELVPPAREIRACLKTWSRGASITPDSLADVAADLWGCRADDVPRAAAERGLYTAPAASDGLRYVLELVAAAERLPEPINAYPEKRAALVETPMEVEVAGACS